MHMPILTHAFIICILEFNIVGFASQFATQNCLDCFSKLNLASKFHAEVATHLPHIILRAPYILNIIYSSVTNCDSIHDLSSNFYAKIATQLYKIISDSVYTITYIYLYLYLYMYSCINTCLHVYVLCAMCVCIVHIHTYVCVSLYIG